ncbi:cysteine desulfurase family protein [Lichenifustis flavocetrariae]|uniref:Cysteine desulfurase n=1 Tax=Lichenifustis flavocetrariae TaxID=2949735 RepID=A0AA42CNT9_9HYPH|nr:cysteine desulfurase family protein [Lichenifustis flavocetrariae]MCW6509737.1 cysteine desulfurase [Lichenifustis flavocetrariae]
MSASRCYLDYNATSPLRLSAREACVAALDLAGNASSIHREGREARRFIEDARRRVGGLFAAAPEQVVFTSGATEAANLMLTPELASPTAPRGIRRLLVQATEHSAVLRGHRFAPDAVTLLRVRPDGVIDLTGLAEALASDGGSPALLALQAANNETGVLQPLREAADLVHASGGLVACDAVQVAGRVAVSLADTGVDVACLSGHKLGGPQGTGAVVLRKGIVLGPAVLRGGGQERGSRSGTENVAGIAGFGAAAAEAGETDGTGRLSELQKLLEKGLADVAADVVVFGAAAPRLPNTTCFAVPHTSAEVLLIALDLAGIAVSTGSACSSGKVSRSHVLEAMGVGPHLSQGALRVSTGWASTTDDIARFLDAFGAALRRMHKRPFAAAA